jgi:hypothetical protein
VLIGISYSGSLLASIKQMFTHRDKKVELQRAVKKIETGRRLR